MSCLVMTPVLIRNPREKASNHFDCDGHFVAVNLDFPVEKVTSIPDAGEISQRLVCTVLAFRAVPHVMWRLP